MPGRPGRAPLRARRQRRRARLDQPASARSAIASTPRPRSMCSRHSSGTVNGHYFDQVPLANSTWRVLLVAPPRAPCSPASRASSKWLPWLIFGAFARRRAWLLALSASRVRGDAARAAKRPSVESRPTPSWRADQHRARAPRATSSRAPTPSSSSSPRSPPTTSRSRCARSARSPSGSPRSRPSTLSERGRRLPRAGPNAAAERMQRLIEDLLEFSRVATQGAAVRAGRPGPR